MRAHFLLPERPYAALSEYLAEHGPSAVIAARAMEPGLLVDRIAASGLRGRGGAGFPTGVKWRSVQRHPCPTRYAVCNAAEGEPGTFKDRWLLRRNPYAVLEGLLIAAHAVGARQAIVGIRASFAAEIARLRAAVEELEAAGLLGGVELAIHEGPEEYLFGEEKALLNAIEGGEPLPREAHYPPYERGLWATASSPNPALVNNAETLAHVPSIVRLGPESFRALGTADTPGTVLYTVSGDVRRPGVYEREAGISLRELLLEVAGGPPRGSIQAVISGVANAAIPGDRLDVPADFGSLALAGSGLGSGGFVVYDDTRSMPRVAQALARFLYVESCNQCTACKWGLRLASTALDEIFDPAEAGPDDLERALHGARSAPQGNRCYLPQEGAVLIPSLIERFRDRFEAQVAVPTEPSERIPVPLLVDFDENTRAFALDSSFDRKRPDWTFEEPAPAGPPRDTRTARSASGAPALHLAPDVAQALVARGAREGRDVDKLANALLREALARSGTEADADSS